MEEKRISPLALKVDRLVKKQEKADYLLMEICSWFKRHTYITETEFNEWANRRYEDYLKEEK